MNTQSLRLDTIVFDAGTQIRAAISEDVVSQYAERMTDGDVFPPVVVFHDGNQYYMSDGFHRGLAAKRNEVRDIEAEVRAGTKKDALWHALGANKTNAHRMTVADKQHAIVLALETWPDMSNKRIAEQSGCSYSYVQRLKSDAMAKDATSGILPTRVIGTDGKSYPASRKSSSKPTAPPKEESKPNSRVAVQQRRDRMREMAAEGHTSRQIAAELNFVERSCRRTLRKEGIDVPADRVVGKTLQHDANRIVSAMVLDAENLTADVSLVEFKRLDREQLGGWIHSLIASRKALEAFIRRLKQEHEKHGQAA